MEIIYLLFVIFAGKAVALWNNLNCPAPRSPENGLSFIFRNGELVHFRCHPGYMMHGKAVAYCVNNRWTAPSPECRPLRKGHKKEEYREKDNDYENLSSYQYYSHQAEDNHHNLTLKERREQLNSKLFNWDKRQKKKGVYGDGPRRVPLINGIWPGKEYQIMTVGPRSTPGPINMVREEVNIAELRQQQFEEVAKHHHLKNPNLDSTLGRKRKGNRKRKNKKYKNSVISDSLEDDRETVISLGKTDDGDALSIAFSRPLNQTDEIKNNINRHRYRHHDPGKKRKGKGKKKWQKLESDTPNVIARTSRVDTSGLAPYSINYIRKGSSSVAELRRPPIENIKDDKNSVNNLAVFDTSCVESFYGRELPMLATPVDHAFVYRYETKKNKKFPFNSYMQVKYRCFTNYTFANSKAQSMYCREAKWVGELPVCVEN